MTFKNALKVMINHKEFERVIKHSKGKDKKQAQEFYDAIKGLDLDKVPEIVLLTACYSPSVFRDAIIFMEMEYKENKEN